MKCAEVLNNPQIKEDPGVSDYNLHRFFLLNIIWPEPEGGLLRKNP